MYVDPFQSSTGKKSDQTGLKFFEKYITFQPSVNHHRKKAWIKKGLKLQLLLSVINDLDSLRGSLCKTSLFPTGLSAKRIYLIFSVRISILIAEMSGRGPQRNQSMEYIKKSYLQLSRGNVGKSQPGGLDLLLKEEGSLFLEFMERWCSHVATIVSQG